MTFTRLSRFGPVERARLAKRNGYQAEAFIAVDKIAEVRQYADKSTKQADAVLEWWQQYAFMATTEGSLDTAVDRLIKDVRRNVLGKRKFKDDDGVAVGGGKELPCNIFDMLRKDKWFDAWLLLAGMSMSDKPSFVRYGYSVPLSVERDGRSGRKRVSRPLAGWRERMDRFSAEAQTQHGQAIPLVYFCPLNSDNNHFTLLEIDERERKIYHYDSMASEGVIDGRVELSSVGKMVQKEFGYLEFEYVEAATPQQKDSSSCGPMVVRNSALRMNGLSVGGWHDFLDPERLRMEIVETFKACISDNAMQRRDREAAADQAKRPRRLDV